MTRAEPVSMHDRRLVRRLLRGDRRAFQQFFDEHFPRLYRFALARVRNDERAAEDIVSRTLDRALDRIHGYRGEAALFTWLCAICRNEIVNRARRNQRWDQHITLTEDHPAIRAAVESLAVPIPDLPAARAEREELGRRVGAVLDLLPTHYGDALEWKYVQGYSVAEIADRLGLTRTAAQSLLARARTAFADAYGSFTEAPKSAPPQRAPS